MHFMLDFLERNPWSFFAGAVHFDPNQGWIQGPVPQALPKTKTFALRKSTLFKNFQRWHPWICY